MKKNILKNIKMEDYSVASTSSTDMDTTSEQAEKFLGFEDFSKFYEVSLVFEKICLLPAIN